MSLFLKDYAEVFGDKMSSTYFHIYLLCAYKRHKSTCFKKLKIGKSKHSIMGIHCTIIPIFL